jgi:phage baseplate assembly protein W
MKEIYSDFDIEFNLNKKTRDVNRKRDYESIRQSLWCLLQTNFYDRKWHPEIGSYFPKMLFSLDHPDLFHLLEDQITNLIQKHEPRVSLQRVSVFHASQVDADKGIVTVEIVYNALELGTEKATFHLERTR